MQQLLTIENEGIFWRRRWCFHHPAIALVKSSGVAVRGQTAQPGRARKMGAGAVEQGRSDAVVLPVGIDEQVLNVTGRRVDRGEPDHQIADFRDPDFLVLDRAAIVVKVEGSCGLPVEGGAAGGQEDFGAAQLVAGHREPNHDSGFPTLKHVLAPPHDTPP